MGWHTYLRLFPLLQHLGLVGAAGPHPGSRGEHRSPLVHAGKSRRDGRRLLCKWFDRAAVALAPKGLLRPPETHTIPEGSRY